VSFASLLIQLLNGLAAASSLFLVSAGLSLIFGVTRIVNFAHGSLYMLGLYIAYSLIEGLGRTPLGFWGAVVLSAFAVGLIGIVIEVVVLRRIYRAPELFQLSSPGAPRTWSVRVRRVSVPPSRSWASASRSTICC
jgi:branched-chain amino acid transport system permease protein